MLRRAIGLLVFLALVASADSYKSQISQLPAGVLNGRTYTHESLGVIYQAPVDWEVTADPSGPVQVDMEHQDNPMNRCAKVLLRIDAPHPVEGRFSSFGYLLAMDSGCFSNPPFPLTLDKKAINKVVDKMFKPFAKTIFASPYGANITGSIVQGHVVINLRGGMIVNALEGRPAPRKEPLDVTTSFSFTELNGRWLVWAYVADQNSAIELDNAVIELRTAVPAQVKK
jgi:hypothetical protein